MPQRWILLAPLAALAGFTLFIGSGTADDPVKKKDDAPAKPKTLKVEKGNLTQTVTLKGVFEGEKGSELQLKPKTYLGSLIVKKAVEHGATVKAGDVLVEFDTEKIDQQIKDAKQDRESAELSLKIAELEAPLAEKQYAMDLAAAERDAKNAEDDAKKFKEIDRPLQIETADQALKSNAFFLETAKDELKQLSKMYKDKDLTEETEEIVLKRYKRNVDMSEFQFHAAKIRYDQVTKIDMPRRDIAVEEGVTKAKMSLVRVKEIQSISQQLKKISLVKMKADHVKAGEKLADLEKDREAMKVVSPVDGLAYFGKSTRGNWSGGSLNVGGSVQSGDVFLTVVPVGKMTFRCDADEKEIVQLQVGNGGRITPTASPLVRLQAKISKLATAPLAGKFEVIADVLETKGKIVPGMTGSMRVTTMTVSDAVTVPSSAVYEEEDGETKYVWLPGNQKKVVTVGITVGDKTQIVNGLKVGDDILPVKLESGGAK